MTSRRTFMSGALTLASGSIAPILAMPQATPTVASTSFFAVRSYGSAGDGLTNDTAAVQKALDACGSAGGGTVYVAPGVYLIGPIFLRSNTVLYLEAGARLKGSSRLADFTVDQSITEQTATSGESVRNGLVTLRDVENVSIAGRGVLDGNGLAFHDANRRHDTHDWSPDYVRQKQDYANPKYGTEDGPWGHDERPGNLLRVLRCKNVSITGVTIQDSPTWTTQIRQSEHVLVHGVHIHSLTSGRRIPNDDGMDLAGCRQVHISDCTIETGDDCIALFGSEQVTVTNCSLRSHSAAIRVGFDDGAVRNCAFSNLTIDANRGLLLNVRGDSSIENVTFSNIIMRAKLPTGHWWGKAEPIHVSAIPWSPKAKEVGKIRNIRFSGITAQSDSGIVLHGCAASLIENVLLENIDLHISNSPLQTSYGGNFDLRSSADPALGLFAHDIPGVYFRYTSGLEIDGLRLQWDEGLPAFFNHAIQGEDFQDVAIRRFQGGSAPGQSKAVIDLRKGSGVTIESCRATAAAPSFLDWQDVSEQRLFVNNDVSKTGQAIRPSLNKFVKTGNLLRTARKG